MEEEGQRAAKCIRWYQVVSRKAWGQREERRSDGATKRRRGRARPGAQSGRGGQTRCRRGMGAWFSPPSTLSGAPHLRPIWRATRGGGVSEIVGKRAKKNFGWNDFRWRERLALGRLLAQHESYERSKEARETWGGG